MESITTQEINSVEIYNRSIETFKSGSDVLANHQLITTKADAAGRSILNRIQEEGMTPEMDGLCMKFLSQCNERRKQMEEGRKPITQIMDAVKRLFTIEEAKMDPKISGALPFLIQEQRNIYARQVAEEQRQREAEARQRQEKEREAAELRAEIERRLQRHFSDALTIEKNRIQSAFNAITLENYEGRKASLLGYSPSYSYDHFNSFNAAIACRLHSKEELESIIAGVTSGKYGDFTTIYNNELLQLKQSLIDRLASKKKELEDMAAADVAEKERLEKLRIERENAETARLKQEEEDRRRKEEEAIELKKSQESTMALFNGAVEAAPSVPAPETRSRYEIIVKHPAGWALLFEFWFRKEGVSLDLAKFPAKKLESIKTFCENYALKNGEKIESTHLQYEETFKAVNRKTAAA